MKLFIYDIVVYMTKYYYKITGMGQSQSAFRIYKFFFHIF